MLNSLKAKLAFNKKNPLKYEKSAFEDGDNKLCHFLYVPNNRSLEC